MCFFLKLTCVRTCAVKLAACEKLLLQSGQLQIRERERKFGIVGEFQFHQKTKIKPNKNEKHGTNIFGIYTDMDVRPNECEDVFSRCSVGHMFYHRVDINLALIPIECNRCYLHRQNLMNFWHFVELFECWEAMMGCAVVNTLSYYWNKMAVAVLMVTFYWNQ